MTTNELAEWKAHALKFEKEVREIRKDIERLLKIVKFYGRHENYRVCHYNDYTHICESSADTCGKRARTYLAKRKLNGETK